MTPASIRVPSVPASDRCTGPDVRRSARTPTASPGATRLGSAVKDVSPPWARTVAESKSAAADAAALEMIARRGPILTRSRRWCEGRAIRGGGAVLVGTVDPSVGRAEDERAERALGRHVVREDLVHDVLRRVPGLRVDPRI